MTIILTACGLCGAEPNEFCKAPTPRSTQDCPRRMPLRRDRYAEDVECTSPRGHHYGDRIHVDDNLGQVCLSCGASRYKPDIKRRVEVNVPEGMTTHDFLIAIGKIRARPEYVHADDQSECDHELTFASVSTPGLFLCAIGRSVVAS